MASGSEKTRKALHTLKAFQNMDTLIKNTHNKKENNIPANGLPGEIIATEAGIQKNLEYLFQKNGFTFFF